MTDDWAIREPEQIRSDCARKVGGVQVSDHFRAILGCLPSETWTTPTLVELVSTPDGHLLGRCAGEAASRVFLGNSEDLLRNIHGVAIVGGAGWGRNRLPAGPRREDSAGLGERGAGTRGEERKAGGGEEGVRR
ncbi:MAG UNVERIFIED_CONTAM: hypothetical protein LVR18_42135 [Planctomycetaceae bacterium]|jgi:hypothetical protein